MQNLLYGLMNLMMIAAMMAIYGGGAFAVIYFAVRLALRHENERINRLGK
jgi:hypothetical protein